MAWRRFVFCSRYMSREDLVVIMPGSWWKKALSWHELLHSPQRMARALGELSQTIKCSSPEVTPVTSLHNSLVWNSSMTPCNHRAPCHQEHCTGHHPHPPNTHTPPHKNPIFILGPSKRLSEDGPVPNWLVKHLSTNYQGFLVGF